ncbi:MAG: type II toxin-antitoxin system RelE/ParE family toxin [Collinsella sp.]|nr:type II toxin-antitoxin system RelE/ParE family toxin [Collinsella sp.]
MMLKLVVSKGAAMELRGIAQCLEGEPASPDAARSLIQEFKHQAELACSFPLSHPLCVHSELAQRVYRSFRVGRYVAIYSVADDCLKVLHVFHQSQDYVRDVLE